MNTTTLQRKLQTYSKVHLTIKAAEVENLPEPHASKPTVTLSIGNDTPYMLDRVVTEDRTSATLRFQGNWVRVSWPHTAIVKIKAENSAKIIHVDFRARKVLS